MLHEMRFRFRILLTLSGLTCLLCVTGCGGVHAEKGFSPLSILMPALMRYEPEKSLPPAPESAPEGPDSVSSPEDNAV